MTELEWFKSLLAQSNGWHPGTIRNIENKISELCHPITKEGLWFWL